MTAEERAVGQARLRSKLNQVEQELAILTEEATELSELLVTTSQTILHRPADLQLTAEQMAKISGVQQLADRIRSLERREVN
jgi:hypothetical protein